VSKIVRGLVVAMLLAVAVYGGIFLYRGVGNIARELETFAWGSFVLGCGLAFSNYTLRFLKWEYYLAVLGIRGIPKRESFLIFLSGFVLTVTPGKVGEVFKSVILNQIRGVPIARTAPIVVAERLTDLIGVILLITVGSLGFPGGMVWAGAGAALVAAILVFVSSRRLSHRMLGLLPRLPGGLGRLFGRIAPKLDEALEQLRGLTAARRLPWPTLLSIAAWSLEGVALWVILRGFGASVPLLLTAFLYATSTLAGALVPVPGGLGITEGALEEQMAHLGGVAPATATAAMFLGRLATLWFAVAVGFLALFLLRLRHPALALGTAPPAGADRGSVARTEKRP
jgi:glycosyltransferase 2 family protein